MANLCLDFLGGGCSAEEAGAEKYNAPEYDSKQVPIQRLLGLYSPHGAYDYD